VNRSKIQIRRAIDRDLEIIIPLFDEYRQFYGQPSDQEGARRFLADRLALNESVIFLAFLEGITISFTQLYPSFSSGAMARTFVLNDLYVAPAGRRKGAGSALLDAAAEHAAEPEQFGLFFRRK
jgi:GNAT superfamily N-acetyltransferase